MDTPVASPQAAQSRVATVAGIASAGIVIGSISVVFGLSFAAIIYDGSLAPYLGQGIGLTLIGAVIMGVIGALTLTYRGTICQPQDVTAILLAVTAATLVDTSQLTPDAAFATVVVLVALSTIATGVIAYLTGRLRLGYVVRYVPLPVISGFLAATGVLLVRSGFEMLVPDLSGDAASVVSRLAADWALWLPWIAIAAVLAILVQLMSSGLVVPVVLLLTTLGFYAVLPLLSLDLTSARELGLLLGPFGDGTFVGDLDPAILGRTDWGVIAAQVPMILAIAGMSILGTLLNASGLELAIKREVDFDKDLRGIGIANVAAGLGGGMVGYHLLGETLLARRIGIGGAAAGFSVSAVCLLGLLFGAGLLSNLPVGLLATVIWFLGFDLLLRAINEHGWRLPWREFALVIVTPVIALVYGFLPAVGFGVLIACLLFIASYAGVDVVRLSTTGATFRARIERSPDDFRLLGERGKSVHIYKLSGFLFFGSAHRLVERVRQGVAGRSAPSIVIVDLEKVSGLDVSALAAFERLSRRFEEQNVEFYLTGLSPHMTAHFQRWTARHASNIALSGALDDVMQAIEEDLLGDGTSDGEVATSTIEAYGADAAHALEQYGEAIALVVGEVIVREGAEADGIFVLTSGRLRVTVVNSKGVSLTVNRLLPGAIFGEVAYYAKGRRTASVVAESAATVLRITAAAFARMERENPAYAATIHRTVADMLARRLTNSTQLLREADV